MVLPLLCNFCRGREAAIVCGLSEQAQDLQASAMNLMSSLHAAVALPLEAEDDSSDENRSKPLADVLKTVKLHHLISHAADDIKNHGHEKHYSTQVGSQASLLFY